MTFTLNVNGGSGRSPTHLGLNLRAQQDFHRTGRGQRRILSRGTQEEERRKEKGHRAPLGGRSRALRGAGPHRPQEPGRPRRRPHENVRAREGAPTRQDPGDPRPHGRSLVFLHRTPGMCPVMPQPHRSPPKTASSGASGEHPCTPAPARGAGGAPLREHAGTR